MPPLYMLNPPMNPFWDFVSGLEDHPFFRGPPGQQNNQGQPASETPRENAWASKSKDAEPEMSEKAQGKKTSVEDPPEVDPTTIDPEKKSDRFRRRGRWAREGEEGDDSDRRCRGGRHGGRRGGPWGGPPPFNPFFGRPPWLDQLGVPGNPEEPPRGPPHWHDQPARPGHPTEHPHGPPHGPPGTHGFGHRGPPHHGHPFGPGRHGPPHHKDHRRRCSPDRPRPDFDLGQFLNNLGQKLGVDLASAAEGFGLTADRFTASKSTQDVDFEPRADIFENKELYTVHLSLPGAKKSDVGVDYDGEHSVLRITGVVHRPDVDEQILNELVVDGRKRETGVFEKAVRLGTKRDPASIDVAGITAKMTDGVLVVKIPRVEKINEKREVPITTDPVDAGEADYEDEYSEKPILFDAEEQASVAGTETGYAQSKGPISLLDQDDIPTKDDKKADTEKDVLKKKEKIALKESGPTAPTASEQLPAYSAQGQREEEDWENFSDASGEGEYVKIDVK